MAPNSFTTEQDDFSFTSDVTWTENQTYVPTSDVSAYPPAARVAYAVLLFFLAAIGIGANLLVLAVIAWTKKSRVSVISSAFLLNLTVSDFMVCSVIIPLALRGLLSDDVQYDEVSCHLIGFLSTLFCTSSIFSVAAIAYDRYQAIINCLEYTTHSSIGYIIKGLCLIHILVIIFSVPPIAGWGGISYSEERFICTVRWADSVGYGVFVFLVTCLVPVAIMTYCYVRIIRIARQHLRRITDINIQVMRITDASRRTPMVDPRSVLGYAMVDPIQRLSLFPEIMVTQSTNDILNSTIRPGGRVSRVGGVGVGGGSVGVGDGDHNANIEGDNISSISNMSNVGTSLKKEARATVRLLGLVLMFIICWLPYHIVNINMGANHGETRSQKGRVFESFVFVLALSKSVINPFFFALGSRRFRYAIKRKLRRKLKHEDQNQKLQRKRYQIANQIASLYNKNSQTDNKTPPEEATASQSKTSLRKKRRPKGTAAKYRYRRKNKESPSRQVGNGNRPPSAPLSKNCSSQILKPLKPLSGIRKSDPIVEENDEGLRQQQHVSQKQIKPQTIVKQHTSDGESTCVPYSGQFFVVECHPNSGRNTAILGPGNKPSSGSLSIQTDNHNNRTGKNVHQYERKKIAHQKKAEDIGGDACARKKARLNVPDVSSTSGRAASVGDSLTPTDILVSNRNQISIHSSSQDDSVSSLRAKTTAM